MREGKYEGKQKGKQKGKKEVWRNKISREKKKTKQRRKKTRRNMKMMRKMKEIKLRKSKWRGDDSDIDRWPSFLTLPTDSVHRFCLPILFTDSVYRFCLSFLFTDSSWEVKKNEKFCPATARRDEILAQNLLLLRSGVKTKRQILRLSTRESTNIRSFDWSFSKSLLKEIEILAFSCDRNNNNKTVLIVNSCVKMIAEKLSRANVVTKQYKQTSSTNIIDKYQHIMLWCYDGWTSIRTPLLASDANFKLNFK